MVRKSPTESATAFSIGTIKKGNDGNMYIVKKVSKSQRWVRYNPLPKGKKYNIHFNYEKPFTVIIENNNNVSIYDNNKNKLALKTKKKPNKIYIGKSKKGSHKPNESKKLDGNTILLDMGKNEFISIQVNIIEFSIPSDDKVIKYYSQIGNNDVPYPILEGNKYIYFLLSEDMTYVDKSKFPKDLKDFEDAYSYYYGYLGKEKLEKYKKKLKKKFIYSE